MPRMNEDPKSECRTCPVNMSRSETGCCRPLRTPTTKKLCGYGCDEHSLRFRPPWSRRLARPSLRWTSTGNYYFGSSAVTNARYVIYARDNGHYLITSLPVVTFGDDAVIDGDTVRLWQPALLKAKEACRRVDEQLWARWLSKQWQASVRSGTN